MQVKNDEGILTGCNQGLEWMLPWWWMHYSMYNTLPVTFLDFGMSKKALTWCQKHGNVMEVPCIPVAKKKDILPETLKIWRKKGFVWKIRTAWFQKPVGLGQTPYRRSIWIDLDCEVRGDLSPVFPLCENSGGLAIQIEREYVQEFLSDMKLQLPEEKNYNSGVVVFRSDSPLIQAWAQRSVKESHLFFGDQDLLSRILFETNLSFTNFPPGIHAIPVRVGKILELREDSLIHHFIGARGKLAIAKKIFELGCDTFLVDVMELMPQSLMRQLDRLDV